MTLSEHQSRWLQRLADDVKALLYLASVVCAIIGILGFVVWRVWLEEIVTDWMSNQVEPLSEETETLGRKVVALDNTLALLSQRLSFVPSSPYLEFRGVGLVDQSIRYNPGDVVPVTYQLRRTSDCDTWVIQRFHSYELGRIDTSLTVRIIATKADITPGFIIFTADVIIPSIAREGWYSYSPILQPDAGDPRCDGFQSITPPMSDRFYVLPVEDFQ